MQPDTQTNFLRSFDPRPREGGDGEPVKPGSSYCVSIHAPARGATRQCHLGSDGRWGFDPRPREGGDWARS